MSLIHWWPLNGDTQDRITNTQLANNGATIVSNGKIGPCYTFNGSTNLTISYPTLNTLGSSPAQFSFAFWIKLNSTWTGWGQVFTIGRNGAAWTDIRLGFDIASDKTGYFTVSDGTTTISTGGPRHILTIGKWHHITATFDNKEMRLFIDGQPASTPRATASILPNLSSDTIIAIGGNGGENGECDISDVRIYDHALSQAEVKELSKALVIHYTFDDILAEPTTNIITGIQSAHGKSSLYGNGVKIDWSAGGGDSYFMFSCSQSIKENSVYTLSFDCEGLKSGEIATFAVSNLNPASYNITLTNGRNSLTFTAGSDLINDGRFFFDDKTRTDGALFYLTNFQLEEKDHATPYTPTSRSSMLRNEAETIQPTYNTNINLVQDSSSGVLSLSCTGSTIINTPITGDITSGATISCWIKTPTYPSENAIVFADYNSKLAFGFYDTQSAIISCGGYSSPYVSNIKSSWINGWNHIVVTRDSGGTISCYLNGGKLTTSNTNNWSSSTGYSTIGGRHNGSYTTYFTGYVDDYRVYHTLLSNADIQELYKTKAYITDQGDIMSGKFVEDKAEAMVTNKRTFECNEVYEEIITDYERLAYIESSGSQYIKTGIQSTDNITKIKAHYYQLNYNPGQILFGCYDGSTTMYFNYKESGSINHRSHWLYTNLATEAPWTANQECRTELTIDGNFLTYTANGYSVSGNATKAKGTSCENYLFAYGERGTPAYHYYCRLYNFQVEVDNVLVRNFIPCRRTSDQVIGLYDAVNQTFYTSAGSGSFIAGPAMTNTYASIYEDGHISGREIIEI